MKIITVYATLDKAKIFSNKHLTVVHDEHPSNIELDIVLTLCILDEQENMEFELFQIENSIDFCLT